MTLALAHSRGWLDYDATVATYWPEFAQQGKERITVRQLLSHQAGLCRIDQPLDARIIANADALADTVARQRPAWPPGERHGYHGISLGWYEGELIRRVDPRRRRLGQFFREEIAEPLGLEFYIGLPPDVPDARIAAIEDFRPIQMALHLNQMPWRFVLAVLNPWSLTSRSLMNPRLRRPAELAGPELRALEIPAGNGIGQVRGIAKAYSVFAGDGRELGLSRATLSALSAPATAPTRGLFDRVMRVEMAYSLGFVKPFPGCRFGSSAAFGTFGMGGSFAFADPEAQLAFAYAPNRSGFCLWDDPREQALREAVYGCLRVRESSGSVESPNQAIQSTVEASQDSRHPTVHKPG
jgi:CubicO group peptidase (beta-lactamase class C family)